MNRIELFSGGFPATITTFEFLQSAYGDAIQALTKLGGDNYIFYGLEISSTAISGGAIVYDGEYLPFLAGDYDDTIGIYETVVNVSYNQDSDNDGTLDVKRAYVQRYAKCGDDGTALQSFAFNILKSFTPLTELSMPIGSIIMWGGLIDDIPQGWQLCDGTNGTPDLTDRFIVGAGAAYNVGDLGGANEIALTENQMPSHSHSGTTSNSGIHKHTGNTLASGQHSHNFRLRVDLNGVGNGEAMSDSPENDEGYQNYSTDPAGSHTHVLDMNDAGSHNHTFATDVKGANAPHENRPPYCALAYIMRINV
jgi:microcystin-dependent protein